MGGTREPGNEGSAIPWLFLEEEREISIKYLLVQSLLPGSSRQYMMEATLVSGFYLKIKTLSQAQWSVPLIPAPGRQRQADLCEFKATLIYILSSRWSGLYKGDPYIGR